MDVTGLLVFAGVYFLAVASPGPGIAAIVARSLSTGFRRAVPFVLGIAIADLVWLAFSALGLSLLMQSFHGVFLAIKYAGCLYLIYLAWKLWTAPVGTLADQPAERGEGVRLFFSGVALTLGNPKVMVFFVSILPLVVDLQAITPLVFVEIAVLTMIIINTTLLGYAYGADRARRLVRSPRALRIVNRLTGGVMAGAAAAIAARG
jgi:threonine/homoserine/homoserine lactone efflux protein